MSRHGVECGIATVALALVGTLAPAVADESAPVDDARRAAEQLAYTGRVTVDWVDPAGAHRVDLDISAGAGILLLDGPAALMARRGERLVRGPSGAWDLLWSATLQPRVPPAANDKYDIVELPGPIVAGRKTTVIEVRYRGTLRDRLFLDGVTGLVLRREQLDPDGRLQRVVAFERVEVGGSRAAPADPRRLRHLEPRRTDAASLGGPYHAPDEVAGGYRRIGTYRRGGTVQVMYSDGLYGLSLFQQRGRLDRDRLPLGGRRVVVGADPGWRWTWAGGEILLWAGGNGVFTAVSDAPFSEVLAAAKSITPSGGGVSAMSKLRRACRAVLRTFA